MMWCAASPECDVINLSLGIPRTRGSTGRAIDHLLRTPPSRAPKAPWRWRQPATTGGAAERQQRVRPSKSASDRGGCHRPGLQRRSPATGAAPQPDLRPRTATISGNEAWGWRAYRGRRHQVRPEPHPGGGGLAIASCSGADTYREPALPWPRYREGRRCAHAAACGPPVISRAQRTSRLAPPDCRPPRRRAFGQAESTPAARPLNLARP